jgi:hypothetical protein
VLKRPVTWIALVLLSLAMAAAAYRGFPLAFSIVAVDISTDRAQALASAREWAARDHLGPTDFREAASFELDDEAQTFVELEGGGKDVFNAMLRDRLYVAYTWNVRHFREGEVNESTVVLTPDGKPYGFTEKIKEDLPGAALESAAARAIAERDAPAWASDLSAYELVEHGQTRRSGGRIDHTFTYERPSPTLGEGRYRIRLVVSGDRLTEVHHFVKVPEAFLRRYDSMRAANTTLGLVSVIGMIVLYGIGGMGVGLFLMMRARAVLWRSAAMWGIGISAVQALVAVNEWPLVWMGYDTSVTHTLFVTQQSIAILASFVGFSLIYTLSFMTAETLTRRAFGQHPQFWHIWSPRAGASVEILGRTVAGYLLVTAFFAYDVGLYVVATHRLGWWSPSEALFHPDVLAAYFPWFSAIANSLQAGFWEECLFRAVPIAGAALIGEKLGYRRTAIVIAFVVQAAIFGSGHAPYPNQPFFARPVELILPSIGFGLLYLYFGLVPGIILHFTFDTTWFALPLFVAHAPGIWIQRVMVVGVVLVPLWMVLWRRARAGHWMHLEAADRNAAWTPEAPTPRVEAPPLVATSQAVGTGTERLWLSLGAVGAAVAVLAAFHHDASARLAASRDEATAAASRALADRGFKADAPWRLMALPEDGAGGAQEFVSETAGDARRKALVGQFLPTPRWNVRVATFEGDVALRAEEWTVFVGSDGQVRRLTHDLPEARPGATLDEAAARTLAHQALVTQLHLDADKGEAREVSAKPEKQKARTDWRFTFVDTTVPPLPQGEPRIDVQLAGDEVVSVGRYIFVPEDWQRQSNATDTRNLILQVVTSLVPTGSGVTLAVLAIVWWSRRRFSAKTCFMAFAQIFVLAAIAYANNWPVLIARLSTSQPYSLQVGGLVGAGGVALLIAAAVPSLITGMLPVGLATTNRLSDRTAIRLGAAAGFIAVAILTLAAWLRTPAWAAAPEVTPLGSMFPIVAVVGGTLSAFLTRLAVVLGVLLGLHRYTQGWTVSRFSGAAAIAVVALGLAGAPVGAAIGGWFAALAICGIGLAALAVFLLSVDLSMTAIAVGVLGAADALMTGAGRAYPTALANGLVAAVAVLALAWWWFRLLRATSAQLR